MTKYMTYLMTKYITDHMTEDMTDPIAIPVITTKIAMSGQFLLPIGSMEGSGKS